MGVEHEANLKSVLEVEKLVKIIKSSYIMIIFQHANKNLFQVADLKQKKNRVTILVLILIREKEV